MSSESFAMSMLPDDWAQGIFAGRLALAEGPTPVLVRDGTVHDMSHVAPTVSELIETRSFDVRHGRALGRIETLLAEPGILLSPIDLQCVKAAGVTFAVSAVERVIEEQARGDASLAAQLRERLEARVGQGIRSVVPGSEDAGALKQALIEEGLWSQYLEVAIGPDAEIFTKAPVLATVGSLAEIGIRSDSSWNNPEPEVVLVADSRGEAVGAMLGNDVNLRDFEGRSALLLSKAKDNNASCALGPLIRLFDRSFSLDHVRQMTVDLRIEGEDGYVLTGTSSMREISRDPEILLRQAMSQHDYPDGFALMLGTLFAPIQDRDEPGRGFTHKVGDRVTVSAPGLGALVNRVVHCADAAPWTFGIVELMRNLAARGLLGGSVRAERAA